MKHKLKSMAILALILVPCLVLSCGDSAEVKVVIETKGGKLTVTEGGGTVSSCQCPCSIQPTGSEAKISCGDGTNQAENKDNTN